MLVEVIIFNVQTRVRYSASPHMNYVTFDELAVNDIIGKECFPYEFATVIQKNGMQAVVQRGEQVLVIDRNIIDKLFLIKHSIADGEIVKNYFTTPTPPTPTQPE